MALKILYSFASRSRPVRFFNCLDNLRQFSASKEYSVIAKLDEDDETMNNDEAKEKLKLYPEVIVRWGLSKNKIHAINRDLDDVPPFDIIIIQSDDIVWEVQGFDDEIREGFATHFPNLDGTLHYPEVHAKARTIIVSILGKALYEKMGYLYYPDYISVFADNDFTDMTKTMEKYVFIDKHLFSHHHPIWNTAAIGD